jgi:hypothetical protein
MDEDSIIDSGGKEYLSDEASVGLTVTLLNARVKFEARGAPPWVACVVKGGNLVAKDTLGDPMDSIEPAAYIQVTIAQSSSPTIVFGSGSGVTEQDKLDIADRVWDETAAEHSYEGSLGAKSQRMVPSESIGDYKADVSVLALESSVQAVKTKTDAIDWDDVAFIKDIEGGRWRFDALTSQMVFYKANNTTEVARFNLKDANGRAADLSRVQVFDRMRT